MLLLMIFTATGDLSDAVTTDGLSTQIVAEWGIYRDIVVTNNLTERWIDTPGNHDIRDEPDGPVHFDLYGVSRRWHVQELLYDFGRYRVIALDATPNPGVSSILNFFGELSAADIELLEDTLAENDRFNQTVIMGHYPLALIDSIEVSSKTGRGFREVIHAHPALLYVCGHLHGNFGEKLYHLHNEGMHEAELNDFKFQSKYRVIAFDNDVFAYEDATLDQEMVIVVFNPKPSYQLSPLEPWQRQLQSRTIRFLLFAIPPCSTTESDLTVRVQIDGNTIGHATRANHPSGQLFELPWDPSPFAIGPHEIRVDVRVHKSSCRSPTHIHHHIFSLDGTLVPLASFPFQSWFALKFPFSVTLRAAVVFFVGFALFATVRLLYPVDPFSARVIICWLVWFAILPWFIGRCTTDHFCVVSLWGIRINGHTVGTLDVWLRALWSLLTCVLPLIAHLIIFSYSSSSDRRNQCAPIIRDAIVVSGNPFRYSVLLLNALFEYILPFYLMVHIQRYVFGNVATNYGMIAIIISPGLAWLPPGALLLIARQQYHRFRASKRHFTDIEAGIKNV